MYTKFIKRMLDFLISLIVIVILFPILILLSIIGALTMGGNPFFTQERPGKNEKIFKLIKFRSMNNKKDSNGKLLPDMQRITKYGHFIRNTSLDELPELLNILKGDMSIVGPRPLLSKYLPLYNEYQRRRHDVRPGLTGYAQVHGRNTVSWEEKFDLDVWYTEHLSFMVDVKLMIQTVVLVFKREGITAEGNGSVTMEEFKGNN